jgi:hypothetical protein
LAATGFATVLTVASLWVPSAYGADLDAANEAGGYLVAQLVDGNHLVSEFGNESITADALLALVATQNPEFSPQVQAMGSYLAGQADSYTAESPEAAAKLAIVAIATNTDPTAFGGVDLVARIKAGIAADGAFGSYPMAYSSGLAIVSLTRVKQEVDPLLVTWLLGQAEPDGSYSYQLGGAADPDNTAMAILALAALPDPSPEAAAALEAAKKWAVQNQQADGSWAGMAAVNSTAVLGSALAAAGDDQTKATTFLAGTQAASGGLPANPGEEQPDELATAQAMLLLSGQSYLTLQAIAASPPAVDTPAPVASPTSTPSAGDSTGTDGSMPVWVIPAAVVVVIAVAAVAIVAVRRKKR